MYTLIEESRRKKGGQVAAVLLKVMIQELVAENFDLKSSSSPILSGFKNIASDNFCSNDASNIAVVDGGVVHSLL